MRLDIPREALADIALVARLGCAGRALGAAERAFELAVDHAKVRKQFGQLIGQFQAVQHKLANCLISLDGARLTLEAAAEARDNGNPDWRVFAASALAFAGPALARGVDRDASGARRHRLCRGARGAAAFPARACRSRPVRRRAARPRRACRFRARAGCAMTALPAHDMGPAAQRLPQGGARLARQALDAGEARRASAQAVQGPRLGPASSPS